MKFCCGDSDLRILFISIWSHSLLQNAKNAFHLLSIKSLKAQENAAELSWNYFSCEESKTCYSAVTLKGHVATEALDEDAAF